MERGRGEGDRGKEREGERELAKYRKNVAKYEQPEKR